MEHCKTKNSSSYDNCNYRLVNSDNNINSNIKIRHRKRKVIWFNPPFCKLSTININKYFLNLIDRHFHKNNPINKIFNRNTLKISYSCTNYISKINYNHKKKLADKSLRDNYTTNKLHCNCRSKEDCPKGGRCNSKKVVFPANIFPMENSKEEKVYIGISAGNWKQMI